MSIETAERAVIRRQILSNPIVDAEARIVYTSHDRGLVKLRALDPNRMVYRAKLSQFPPEQQPMVRSQMLVRFSANRQPKLGVGEVPIVSKIELI